MVFEMFSDQARKRKAGFFKFLQFKEGFIFKKLRFRDGLVWTEILTVEIKLRFQIPAPKCGQGPRRLFLFLIEFAS